MAQDVIAHGVTYNNISEVNMPLTDGGTARFFDISDTTAEASDVVEGRVIYDANGIRTVGTADPHGGLPSGGLTNEVLTKISDEDYDIDWMPVPVTSVNGKGGDVILDASDVGAAPSDAYASTSEYGIVKLSNSVQLRDQSLAATASAVAVAYTYADNAYLEAYQAMSRSISAYSLASNAYTLASSAYSRANTAHSWATSAYSTANSASTKANSAQSTANSASSAATAAGASASAALELANNAISQSSSALSLASDAISEASIAYSLASNAHALAETKVTAEEAAAAAPVQSVNNQTGNITLTAADIGALPSDTALPSKVSDLDNDLGFISTEVDPTVPAWAKASAKPSYTAEEVGALPNTTAIPSKVSDLNNDLGFITVETDPTVPSWAKASNKPEYNANEVGAIAVPTAASSGQLLGYDGSEWTAVTVDFNSLPSGGLTGQVLAKSSNDDYAVAWTTPSGGGSEHGLPSGGESGQVLKKTDSSDYATEWGDIPVQSVNNKTGAIILVPSDIGAGTYSKPSTGIPSTDLSSSVQASLNSANTAYQKPSTGIPSSDLANGVIPIVPTAYNSTPASLGTASAGTSTSWAKGDHVHQMPTALDIGALPASTAIPSKVSDLNNDLGFITSETDPTVPSWAKASTKPSYTASEVGALPVNTAIPSKVSDLNNDLGFVTASGAASAAPVQSVNSKTGAVNLSASDVGALPQNTAIPSCAADVGALPSDTFIPSVASDVGAIPVPASASSDNVLAYNGSAWVADKRTVILSYGHSTWAEFLSAYHANAVIYCRASSNSNPGTGSQTRMAFMAYVNNADNPTNVEFQYYRSVNQHSATQQGDQMYVYKLDKTAGWTVTVRESYTKIVAGTGLSSSYANSTLTLTNAAAVPSGGTTGQALVKTSNTNYAAAWQTIDATLPVVTTSDNGKVLRVVNGAWAAAQLSSANGVIF